MKHAYVLDVPITISPENEIMEAVVLALQQQRQLIISTPNPEILVAAQRNSHYREVLRSVDIALPDGIGVVLAMRLQNIHIVRITGRDFFEKIVSLANRSKASVYLVGGSKNSNTTSVERIKHEFPDCQVAGTSEINVNNDGRGDHREVDVIKQIENENPSIVFVAFGHPKQELWIDRIKSQFPHTIFMAVGGTLDYFSKQVPNPPQWVTAIGVEWLYRLLIHPWRIKRIIDAIIVFPFILIRNSVVQWR